MTINSVQCLGSYLSIFMCMRRLLRLYLDGKPGLLEHVQFKHQRNKTNATENLKSLISKSLKAVQIAVQKFWNDFDLYKHACQEVQHDPDNIQPSPSFECSECGQIFKFRIRLLKHVKIHAKSPENDEEDSRSQLEKIKHWAKLPVAIYSTGVEIHGASTEQNFKQISNYIGRTDRGRNAGDSSSVTFALSRRL